MEFIDKYFKQGLDLIGLNAKYQWIAELFVIVLVILTINFFLVRFLGMIQKRLSNTQNSWDDAVFCAVRRPIRAVMWLIGISYAVDRLTLTKSLHKSLDDFEFIGWVAIASWTIIRFIRTFESNIVDRAEERGKKVDKTTTSAVSNILRLAVLITAALTLLESFGVSLTGLLAFGGMGGIAVGFAAKDLLSNFFGAIMIYLDRPFDIGDWIRSPDRNIEGTVVKIGWRACIIRTFDKRPLYVPNSIFSEVVVENPSRMTNRRIKETIGIRYADISETKTIVDAIRDFIKNHKEIDKRQTIIVNLNEFNASSVDILVYCFTKTKDWVKFHHIKEEILLSINDVIEKHGGEIAFPTRTLHIEKPDYSEDLIKS